MVGGALSFVREKREAMPPQMVGSPPQLNKPVSLAREMEQPSQQEARRKAVMKEAPPKTMNAREKMEEINRQRSLDEKRKADYKKWVEENDAPLGRDDGVEVSDMGVFRTQPWVRSLEDGPDPPRGRDSMVNHWLPDKLVPDFATYAARQSVRQQVENGVLVKQIGWDKSGNFHPVRHFHAGSAYERYRRGMPPGYMGHIPHDATPVTGGKIGVIEKAHPLLYSTVRPATGHVVADLMDDKISSAGVQ